MVMLMVMVMLMAMVMVMGTVICPGGFWLPRSFTIGQRIWDLPRIVCSGGSRFFGGTDGDGDGDGDGVGYGREVVAPPQTTVNGGSRARV